GRRRDGRGGARGARRPQARPARPRRDRRGDRGARRRRARRAGARATTGTMTDLGRQKGPQMAESDSDNGSIRMLVPKNLTPPKGYSHVALVRPGRRQLAYISGQVSADETGAVVGPGNFLAQLEQVFANLHRA